MELKPRLILDGGANARRVSRTHKGGRSAIRAGACVHDCVRACVRARARVGACVRVRVRACVRACVRVRARACVRAC
eukprot:851642-Pleurochrysis_carterae.AAC.1